MYCVCNIYTFFRPEAHNLSHILETVMIEGRNRPYIFLLKTDRASKFLWVCLDNSHRF